MAAFVSAWEKYLLDAEKSSGKYAAAHLPLPDDFDDLEICRPSLGWRDDDASECETPFFRRD